MKRGVVSTRVSLPYDLLRLSLRFPDFAHCCLTCCYYCCTATVTDTAQLSIYFLFSRPCDVVPYAHSLHAPSSLCFAALGPPCMSFLVVWVVPSTAGCSHRGALHSRQHTLWLLCAVRRTPPLLPTMGAVSVPPPMLLS